MCIYGVRITFLLFAPVPETGCLMWHAGLTLTLTLVELHWSKPESTYYASSSIKASNMKGFSNLDLQTFFFPRSFFLQSFGFGLLYWSVSRQRNDCFTGQSPGDKGGVAKSKPCSLRGQRAHVACGRGFRCVVGRASTLLWEEVSSHNKLAARAVKVA